MVDVMSMEHLEKHADEADAVIDILKKKLNAIESVDPPNELITLRSENASLKAEVASLIHKLDAIENAHGKPAAKMTKNPNPPREKDPNFSHGMNPGQVTSDTSTNIVTTVAATAVKDSKKKEKKKPKTENVNLSSSTTSDVISVSRLDMRVGRIVDVVYHPDADGLYVEQIDVGEDAPRTVISGLRKHVTMEEMNNRLVIVMLNLKPAKMRGILSQGMVMCASSPDKVEIITVPDGAVPGDRITFEGESGEPDAVLNPKKKIWESLAPDMATNEERVACWKGKPFTVDGKGVCVAPTLTSVSVK